MQSSDIKKLRNLEEENLKLKQIYADLALDHRILKDVIEKSFNARSTERISLNNYIWT